MFYYTKGLMRIKELFGIYIREDGWISRKLEGPWLKGTRCPCHLTNLNCVYYRVYSSAETDFLSAETDFSKSSEYVHRLVAYAFVPNPNPTKFKFVDHINGDKLDNRAENLRWLTHQLNTMNRSLVPKAYKVFKLNKYQSKFSAKGITYRTKYCDTKEEARTLCSQMKANKFREIYLSHLENHENSQVPNHQYISAKSPDPPVRHKLSHTQNSRDMRRRATFCVVPHCIPKNLETLIKKEE